MYLMVLGIRHARQMMRETSAAAVPPPAMTKGNFRQSSGKKLAAKIFSAAPAKVCFSVLSLFLLMTEGNPVRDS
jgi:hypothetical protein